MLTHPDDHLMIQTATVCLELTLALEMHDHAEAKQMSGVQQRDQTAPVTIRKPSLQVDCQAGDKPP